jgi:hypothetical protein
MALYDDMIVSDVPVLEPMDMKKSDRLERLHQPLQNIRQDITQVGSVAYVEGIDVEKEIWSTALFNFPTRQPPARHCSPAGEAGGSRA